MNNSQKSVTSQNSPKSFTMEQDNPFVSPSLTQPQTPEGANSAEKKAAHTEWLRNLKANKTTEEIEMLLDSLDIDAQQNVRKELQKLTSPKSKSIKPGLKPAARAVVSIP